MGSMASCARWTEVVSPDVIRIVYINGHVDEFPAPVSAKLVLQDHPRHFIRSSRDLYGACCPALQPEEELRLGELYFLLPLLALQSAENLLALAARLYAAARKDASRAAQRRRSVDNASNLSAEVRRGHLHNIQKQVVEASSAYNPGDQLLWLSPSLQRLTSLKMGFE